jgi:D-alanyl-D-alanine carboxypeptidase/D-alanyl-D-alanine-endopeptidase (penicillin-binding protein 4)
VLVMDAAGNELVAQNTISPSSRPGHQDRDGLAGDGGPGGDYRFETRFYLDEAEALRARRRRSFLISEELAPLATELVAAIGTKPITVVLDASYYPSNSASRHREQHRRGLQCAELRAGGEFQHGQRRAQRQQGALRRDADPDHPARDYPVPAAGPNGKGRISLSQNLTQSLQYAGELIAAFIARAGGSVG